MNIREKAIEFAKKFKLMEDSPYPILASTEESMILLDAFIAEVDAFDKLQSERRRTFERYLNAKKKIAALEGLIEAQNEIFRDIRSEMTNSEPNIDFQWCINQCQEALELKFVY